MARTVRCTAVQKKIPPWCIFPFDPVSTSPYTPLTTPAQVAELVDALASGASIGNDVEVRVLSWAPTPCIRVLQKISDECENEPYQTVVCLMGFHCRSLKPILRGGLRGGLDGLHYTNFQHERSRPSQRANMAMVQACGFRKAISTVVSGSARERSHLGKGTPQA